MGFRVNQSSGSGSCHLELYGQNWAAVTQIPTQKTSFLPQTKGEAQLFGLLGQDQVGPYAPNPDSAWSDTLSLGQWGLGSQLAPTSSFPPAQRVLRPSHQSYDEMLLLFL